jgi:iron complex transport system permease protein
MTPSRTDAAGNVRRLKEEYHRFTGQRYLFIAGCCVVILILVGIATTLGSADLTIGEVYAAIAARFFPNTFESTALASTIVWDYRLHRVLFAVAAGFGLGVAGAVMQSVLRNPLASPFTLGIAAAASFGASLVIVFGIGQLTDELAVIISAFLFTLLAAFAIYGLSRYRGISPESMVLAGIILMYLFSAMTSFLQYTGTTEQLQEVVFWMFGSLQRTTWGKLALVSVVIVVCLPYILMRSWDLNAMGQGDQVAKSMGVNVSRTRTGLMMLAALITAVIICFTGIIGFIGLVSPHITRLAIGGDNRFLIPAAGLVGAALLLAADSLARTILAPAIIPVGIMTAFIGIPFFLYLFLRHREGYW